MEVGPSTAPQAAEKRVFQQPANRMQAARGVARFRPVNKTGPCGPVKSCNISRPGFFGPVSPSGGSDDGPKHVKDDSEKLRESPSPRGPRRPCGGLSGTRVVGGRHYPSMG